MSEHIKEQEELNYYTTVETRIMTDDSMSYATRMIYAFLMSLIKKRGFTKKTNNEFSNMFNVPVRTLQDALRVLKDKGYFVTHENDYGEREIWLKEAYERENKPERELDEIEKAFALDKSSQKGVKNKKAMKAWTEKALRNITEKQYANLKAEFEKFKLDYLRDKYAHKAVYCFKMDDRFLNSTIEDVLEGENKYVVEYYISGVGRKKIEYKKDINNLEENLIKQAINPLINFEDILKEVKNEND